jgi:hypothetical protein
MLTKVHILLAAAALSAIAGAGLANAQTASDGSTSPGGLVTESGGALDSFTSGRPKGSFAPLAAGASSAALGRMAVLQFIRRRHKITDDRNAVPAASRRCPLRWRRRLRLNK